jgi:thioredoxin
MELTATELREKIKNGEKMIIDFWAPWCGPCRVMKPMFENASKTLTEQKSDVNLYTMDIEANKELISELGIRSVPTIKGYSNGSEIFTEVGLKQTPLILEMTKKLN